MRLVPPFRLPWIVLGAWLMATAGDAAASERFKSWRAACIDGACAAETKSLGGNALLRISRMSGRAAPWHVSLLGLDVEPGSESQIGFWLNGSPALRLAAPAAFRVLEGNHFVADDDALAMLFPGLRLGRRLAVTYAPSDGRRHSHAFSLNGLDEALAWIDGRQSRSGSPQSVSAPGAIGRKLAQAQTQAVGRDDRQAEPAALPEKIAQAIAADPECDMHTRMPQIFKEGSVRAKLGQDKTLFLLPCWAGAYNTGFRIYVFDRRYPEDVRPEYFAAYSNNRGWYGKAALVNATWDADSKTLIAHELGRGIGDCGSLIKYRWTADGLRLIKFQHWETCNGRRTAENWPIIYKHEKNSRR